MNVDATVYIWRSYLVYDKLFTVDRMNSTQPAVMRATQETIRYAPPRYPLPGTLVATAIIQSSNSSSILLLQKPLQSQRKYLSSSRAAAAAAAAIVYLVHGEVGNAYCTYLIFFFIRAKDNEDTLHSQSSCPAGTYHVQRTY